MSSVPSDRPTVVVVGLGPAGPEHTTAAAADALANAPVSLLRTSRHPAAEPWLTRANVVTLDHCYETGETFDEVYSLIAAAVSASALEHGKVAYGVPGSPSIAERTVELLRRDDAIALEIVPGLSFCDLAWVRLGIDPIESAVRLVDAHSFAVQAAGDPGPLLVAQCWSRGVLSEVKLCVDTDPGPAVILHHLGLCDEVVVEVPWAEIDKTLEADHLTSLYVPSLRSPVAGEMARLRELVQELRVRCPWDAEQTHGSLTPHLLEETYEAMEALESLGGDPEGAPAEVVAHVLEELGDVLIQVVFQAVLAEEEGLFDLADVARGVHDKLVGRHPHVFGDVIATTPGAVLANWERNKQVEKRRTHLFEGIPQAMPALARATKAEHKLGSVDLGWPATGLDAGALVEALAGLLRLSDSSCTLDAGTSDAVGALLLDEARLIAHRGEDPETLVRRALAALEARVGVLEASAGGLDGLNVLDPVGRVELWQASDSAD